MNKVKFSDIFEFQKKSNIKAGEGITEGSYPFYTSSPFVSKYLNTFQFKHPSLIFGTGGNASVHITETPFSTSTDCLVSNLTEKAEQNFDIKYVYYYLYGNINILEKGFKGAGLKHISKDYIGKIEIPIQPLELQRKIIKTLDQAVSLRQKRKLAVDLLDEYLKSVFLEMFGDPITNTKQWLTIELNDLCSQVVDCPHSTPVYSDTQTDYACIRSSDLQNGFIVFSTTKYVNKDEYLKRIARTKPQEGDIIYCREGARFGAFGYLFGNVDICLGQRTMLLRANKEISTPEFIWGLMNSQGIIYQANQLVNQAAAPHVNVKDIKKFKSFKPPLNLQQRYSNTFKEAVLIKDKMLKQSEDLDNQFEALMQKGFSSN